MALELSLGYFVGSTDIIASIICRNMRHFSSTYFNTNPNPTVGLAATPLRLKYGNLPSLIVLFFSLSIDGHCDCGLRFVYSLPCSVTLLLLTWLTASQPSHGPQSVDSRIKPTKKQPTLREMQSGGMQYFSFPL